MNKKQLKGIVSVGTKFHAYYTAQSLLKCDKLKTLICGRKHKCNLPSEKVINISIPQYLGIGIRKIKILNRLFNYNIISDLLFDKLAVRKLAVRKLHNVDFFIGFNNYVLYQFKYLKDKNVKMFLDQRTAHGNYEKEIGLLEYGKVPKNLSKKMLKRKEDEIEMADYILVPSKFVYQTMVENNVEKEKLILLPYGYNENLFYNKNIRSRKETLNLIFVGSICHRKGCKYLLEAYSELRKEIDITLTMVGNIEPEFEKVFNNYRSIIEYKGYVNNEKLVELYNKADIFIFPSLCEGSALVTYEALACGLPLIVTYNTGSVIEDGKEGYVIQPRSIDEIKKSIIKMYNDRDLVDKMSQQALKTVKDFTWDKYAENLNNIIKKCCD